MERRPLYFIPYILQFLGFAGSLFANSIEDQASKMLYFEQPLRFEQIDSSPLELFTSEKYPFPLLYPSEVSFFKLIDYADPSFQSLETLSRLPVLNKFAGRNRKNRLVSPKKKSDAKLAKDARDLALRVADPVTQFLHSAPSNSLPTDDELNLFLKSAAKDSLSSENISDIPHSEIPSAQSLSDFRNQAESALLNRIFKSETIKKEALPPNSPAEIVEIPVAPNGNPFKGAFSSTVKLRAQKPNNRGQLEPAQASEFYLTTQNLQELLQNLNAGSAVAGELKSVAEIWAKAEKNATLAPEVALGVKSIMLQAKVSKARTDPFGKAALRGVQPDEKYFLIGIDKDVQSNVVTIWSKEVDVQPGENLVELSSNDVIYQE